MGVTIVPFLCTTQQNINDKLATIKPVLDLDNNISSWARRNRYSQPPVMNVSFN